MTYSDIYEIYLYCKENNIQLTREVLQFLNEHSCLNKEEFCILQCPLHVIKLYFERVRTNITSDGQEALQLCLAWKNEKIGDNPKLLSILASLPNCYFMSEFIKACENDVVRNNPMFLSLIASQSNPSCMKQVRLACENEGIRNNLEFLSLILLQTDANCMECMRLACADDKICRHSKLLKFLSICDNSTLMSYILFVCQFPEVLDDEEILSLVFQFNTYGVRNLAELCKYSEIRTDKRLFSLLVSRMNDVPKVAVRLFCDWIMKGEAWIISHTSFNSEKAKHMIESFFGDLVNEANFSKFQENRYQVENIQKVEDQFFRDDIIRIDRDDFIHVYEKNYALRLILKNKDIDEDYESY